MKNGLRMESGAIIENIAILLSLVLITYSFHNRDRPMALNESDKKFIAQIKSMPLEQARRELATGAFGVPGSPNYPFVSSLIELKEAEARDKRDDRIESMSRKALFNSRVANIIAITAIVLSTITAIAIAVITLKCSI